MNDTTLANIAGAEISWFAPLCNGDDDFLGDRNPLYKSSWEHTSAIVKTADQLGFKNVLCPSSYQVGQDPLSFVAGMSSQTEKINFLVNNKSFKLDGNCSIIIDIKNNEDTIIIKSNCAHLRPLVFNYKDDFIDVHHS